MRIAILFLAFAAAAHAATGGKGSQAATGAQAPMRASNGFTRGGGYPVNRPMPGPLDAKRKINEQDCSKPIDFTAGNLKCK